MMKKEKTIHKMKKPCNFDQTFLQTVPDCPCFYKGHQTASFYNDLMVENVRPGDAEMRCR